MSAVLQPLIRKKPPTKLHHALSPRPNLPILQCWRRTSSIRGFANSVRLERQADYTHAVIGGGAVGLAIARRLQMRGESHGGSVGRTLLIERNGGVGMETSSRNSEVIHAGLYYGPTSLKTRLCIRGKELLYSLCRTHSIPHKNTKKWIVAQDAAQYTELEKVHAFSKQINVPTSFIPLSTASTLEPTVLAKAGILESPTTGILDSHSYMQFLHQDFSDHGGDTALHSNVTAITPLGSGLEKERGSSGWEITTRDAASGEETTIVAETIINSAGLGACDVNNMIVPRDQWKPQFYAKGNYFSYTSPLPSPRPKTLIYPAPTPGLGGLGTHLTLDIAGNIRFGPDIEWVDSPTDLKVNDRRLPEAIEQIRLFFPGIKEEGLHPDYAGIRPKLSREGAVGTGRGFVDFWIRREAGWRGWVNLLGIESPGLTSSLAIGEYVEELLYG